MVDIHLTDAIDQGMLVPLLSKQYMDEPTPISLVSPPQRHQVPRVRIFLDFLADRLVLLRHKLRRKRPCFFAAQHGQRERLATSLTISRRRRVAIEFGTWRSGRSGGASGSVTLGKGKFREENFGN
jgi:hypothetical protein